eukprot:gene1124-1193_t
MPVKKKVIRKKSDSEDGVDLRVTQSVVQYNPDVIENALKELSNLIDTKVLQIQRDADFMITSLQHEFQCEMFKLPKQVKEMSLKRFQEEFGENIDAVTRSTLASSLKAGENRNFNILEKNNNNNTSSNNILQKPGASTVFQTPANNKKQNPPGTIARLPREGEQIVSANGSPLGEFSTVKKPMKDGNGIIPQTPGVFVPLKSGEVVDLEAVDPEDLTQEKKEETLQQLESMMSNMQAMMDKLKSRM